MVKTYANRDLSGKAMSSSKPTTTKRKKQSQGDSSPSFQQSAVPMPFASKQPSNPGELKIIAFEKTFDVANVEPVVDLKKPGSSALPAKRGKALVIDKA